MLASGRWPPAAWVAGGLLFVLLATANGAGYRYGVSDQAFYIPAVVRALDPGAFPRDAPLIDGQARLILTDELIATVVRLSGLRLDTLFLSAYLLSLAIIWAGLALIGSRVYHTSWATVALGAAFTLRHRITRTSANSLEPYFHPRVFAFGLGILAVAALLRRRVWLAVAAVAVSALIHVTTAIWFGVVIGVALLVLDRALRPLALAGGAAAAVLLGWAVTTGPLRASLTVMDATWLEAVASKDSLFASEWPIWAWVANLGTFAALWWAHGYRRRVGRDTAEERALVWGVSALVGMFLVTLPAVSARLALPVQLQMSRVFWLVDFLALVYVLAVVADRRGVSSDERRVPWRPVIVAVVLMAASFARGGYVMFVERPERALFSTQLTATPWEEAMRWLAQTEPDAHVLADPGHAWKYNTSVRVSAARDVFLEEVKDSAIAIYSREVAMRVVERTAAIGDFGALTAERARALAARFDLHYLVTDAELSLPLVYSNEQFRIYSLDGKRTAARTR